MSHLKLLIYYFSKEKDYKGNNLGPFRGNSFPFGGWNFLCSGEEDVSEKFCDLKNDPTNSGQPLIFIASVAEFWILEFCSARSSCWYGKSNNSIEKSGVLLQGIISQELETLKYKASSVLPLFHNYSAKLRLFSQLWSKAWSVWLYLFTVFNHLDLHYYS